MRRYIYASFFFRILFPLRVCDKNTEKRKLSSFTKTERREEEKKKKRIYIFICGIIYFIFIIEKKNVKKREKRKEKKRNVFDRKKNQK
jgi:hypothetical protein